MIDIESVELTGYNNLLLFTFELSLSPCAREKITHLQFAAKITAIVRTENHRLKLLHRTYFQHSIPVDGLIGKRVRFELIMPQLQVPVVVGVYSATAATVDKEGTLHQAPMATKSALRI